MIYHTVLLYGFIWHVDAVVGFHLCFQGFSKLFVNSVPTPWKAHDHPGRERVLGQVGQGAQISSSEFLGIGDLPLASHHA